ncbi:hypothetical protein D7Z54_10050 [Salibacterium salarium]|uniref:SLH domain-containing protein n=1 Tax=Salibacterium salarium TaxID=284579 RepID=A0A428N5F8_9BACI|nr:CAP-associated domain-containing protein [Salibacterium salarium]RSL33641.1 hypothetical protein D7Z54_10050 [Salibacterium salarium]
MNKKVTLLLSLAGLLIISPSMIQAETAYTDVDASFWAVDEIQYVTKQDVVSGYDDNTFRPKENVSRAQTAKMLANALDLNVENPTDPGFSDVEEDSYYYPYIAAVANEGIMTGDGETFEKNDTLSRAQMAVVLSNAFRFEKTEEDRSFSDIPDDYWAMDSIKRLAANKITSGHEDGSFGPGESTTRAQFSVFLSRGMNEDFRVESVNTPPSDVGSEEEVWHFRGVTLGDSEEKLKETLGEPEAVEQSRYGFEWNLYHDNYNNYVQIGVESGEIVAAYSNQDTWSGSHDLDLDDKQNDVLEAYGTPLEYIQKGGSNFSTETEDSSDTFKEDGQYTTYFYDTHRNNLVTAVLIVDDGVEESFRQYYAEPDRSLKQSYESQIFHLVNAQRQRYDRRILEWDDKVAETAYSHSVDMAQNHFFEHENLDGEDPFDRMSDDGISYQDAAENIAYGQVSPIYVHQSWMNSNSGHREALLGDYHRLGVGVAFDEVRKQPYYTQNFYTPK